MASRLNGTVALVTGASSGIGEATALALAREGATVAIAARRSNRLVVLAARIGESGGTALVLEADVAAEGRAQHIVERTVAEYGRLDVLVNNAGVMLLGRIEGADLAQWRRMLDLNVAALMTLTHAALPHLLDAADREPRHVGRIERLSAEDIAEVILFTVTRPRHVALNEILVRPTDQVE